MAYNIHITGSNTSDGSLQLSDSGRTRAHKGSKVKWKIDDNNVQSIQIVAKPGSPNIWSTHPHRSGNREWEGTTLQNVADYTEYKYSINWTSPNGSHTHDPIIAMKPSGFDHRLRFALFVTAAAVAAICALKFLESKKHR